MGANQSPFWKTRRPEDLSLPQWERLCDRCGWCCVKKLEDADSERIYFTNVCCRLLDTDTCLCTAYVQRRQKVADCIVLTPRRLSRYTWLPPTCAYRRFSEGKSLFTWHHLISGSLETVHEAGMSVRGTVISEEFIHPDQLPDHVVEWPL